MMSVVASKCVFGWLVKDVSEELKALEKFSSRREVFVVWWVLRLLPVDSR